MSLIESACDNECDTTLHLRELDRALRNLERRARASVGYRERRDGRKGGDEGGLRREAPLGSCGVKAAPSGPRRNRGSSSCCALVCLRATAPSVTSRFGEEE